MPQSTREERLRAEFEALTLLKESSSILEFESTGDPPDRYTIVLRGKGPARDTAAHRDVELVEIHRCDVRLPYSFPQRGPDIRWLTPIFHPNVSFSGFVNLREIGLPWEKDLTLEVVCERLWDVARCAYMNLDKATNYSAKNWFENDETLRLPVDPRMLRDRMTPTSSNIIRYERRGDRAIDLPAAESDTEVFFIGEDTPTPDMPARSMPPRRVRTTDGDDDILFIGE